MKQYGKRNAMDVVIWLKNYDNLFTATCSLCQSQLCGLSSPLLSRCYCGKDAFLLPTCRHFDTGAAFHPSCCHGELLLRV